MEVHTEVRGRESRVLLGLRCGLDIFLWMQASHYLCEFSGKRTPKPRVLLTVLRQPMDWRILHFIFYFFFPVGSLLFLPGICNLGGPEELLMLRNLLSSMSVFKLLHKIFVSKLPEASSELYLAPSAERSLGDSMINQ